MKADPQRLATRGGVAVPARSTGGGGTAVWLERAAFFVLLLVVGMRPLLSETYESSEGMFADYVRGSDFATPAMTAGFDLVIWLAALATTAAMLVRKRASRDGDAAGLRWQWTGLEIGWLVMVLAAAVSTVWAGNKRLALNATVDWLSTLALAMVLANLCRDRLRIALVLAVIVAAGAASTAKSVMQVTYEYRLTLEDYQQNKEKIWRGVPPDDSRVRLYERRLHANEATGFQAFSNAEGSLLLLAGFAAVAAGGLTGLRWSRWALYGGGAAICAAILLTGSKGAMLAAGGGLILLLALHFLQSTLRQHWRSTLAFAWAALLLGAIGVTAFGMARGGLPGSSLGFRWNYWQVTAQVVKEHPWVGVGALNFNQAYMRHKPIDFPEEIRDPHNFVLAILAQWGLLGAVGMVLAMAGASIVAARRWAQESTDTGGELAPPDDGGQALRRWIPIVVAGFVLLRVWLMRGLLENASGQATIFVDLVQYGLVWVACLAAVTAAGLAAAGRGGTGYRTAVLCGIAAFLLHNAIDFSLFVPGALTMFAAMAGVLLTGTALDRKHEMVPAGTASVQAGGRGTPGRRVEMWPMLVASVGLLLAFFLVFIPVGRSSAALAEARSLPMPAAEEYYQGAAAADPLDPVPLSEIVERFTHDPRADRVEATLAALAGAIERDPHDVGLYRWRSQLYGLRYQLTGSESDLKEAIASARKVLELYPQSPDEHLGLATALAHAATATGSPEWAKEAREEYAKALSLDTARPGTDEVRKWLPGRRAEVEAAMNALSAAIQTRPADRAASTRPDGTAGPTRAE